MSFVHNWQGVGGEVIVNPLTNPHVMFDSVLGVVAQLFDARPSELEFHGSILRISTSFSTSVLSNFSLNTRNKEH